MSEMQRALQIADRVLDRANADPDDDLAVLARQLRRAAEIAAAHSVNHRARQADVSLPAVLEAALGLLAKNQIHGGLPEDYCATCGGRCARKAPLS